MNKKSTSKTPWFLRFLLSIYGIVYLAYIAFKVFRADDPDAWNTENTVLKILFGVFVIAYLLSWKKELIAAAIFLFWFLGMVIVDLFLCKSNCGSGILMGMPLFIIGILMIVYSAKEEVEN
jgi:hypothetical protein